MRPQLLWVTLLIVEGFMANRSGAHQPGMFYLSLPSAETDPLSDISSEIEDCHELASYDDFCGLSDEQVSRIARDSLEQNHGQPSSEPGHDSTDHNLFHDPNSQD